MTTLLLASTSVSAQIAFRNLTEDVGRGFGSAWNRYVWAMGELNGKTYVGTWSTQPEYCELVEGVVDGSVFALLGDVFGGGNPLEAIGILVSDGAEIWRHDGGKSWTRVYKADPTTPGFRKAVTHNSVLYMGALNSEQGTRVLYTADGLTWQDLTGGPMNNPENISIRTMLSYDGQLFVGTENNSTGGELWTYDDIAGTWSHLKTFVDDSSVAELAIWDDRIAVGTWDFTDSFNFYLEDSEGQWIRATPDFSGGQALNNVGVMKLIVFQGRMYLGTANYIDGFTLLRSSAPDDVDSWEVISTDGFGNPNNKYVWAMIEWDGKLMLGTFNSGSDSVDAVGPMIKMRAELYSSFDGLNWQYVPGDYAKVYNFGIRNMLVTPSGDLLLGMASNSFLPDLTGSLYTPMFIDMFGSAWLAQAAQLALNASICLATGQDPTGPWLGCEVYRVSKVPPAEEPSSLLRLLPIWP